MISIFVLGKIRVKVSFEVDKIIMTKSGVFVGKDYCFGKLFKLNVLKVIIMKIFLIMLILILLLIILLLMLLTLSIYGMEDMVM